MTGLLHHRVSAVAARYPDRVAVHAGEERLTYRDLDGRAARLAHRLRRAGVPPDGVVAVPVDKASPGFVVAALAAWKAGGVYLPLDPRAPRAHVAALLAGVEATALVGSGAGPYAGLVPIAIPLDEAGDLDGPPPDGPHPPDPLAYIVHTSGSTGAPKPVAVGHRALLSVYSGWAEAYGLAASPGTWLQAAGPAFDVHVGDLTRALLSGGRLVPCPTDVLLDPPRLAGLMERAAVDMLELTPTVWRLLAGWCARSGRRLPPVRLAVAGGERLTGTDLALLRRVLAPETRIVNSYGVAEAGIDSTYHDTGRDGADGDEVPIGQPFPGVGVAVLDGALQPVSDGGIGELYLAGRGLAHGYHRRPALTAERFLPAAAGLPGRLMYRTGDLVRRRADGALVYVGRTDDEVKVRGARVSLSAVEAILRALPPVGDVVALRDVRAGEEVLVAHAVLAAGTDHTQWTGDRLRAELAARAPDPMVPAEVRVHERLPVGPTGKVDRAALAGRDARGDGRAGFAGRTPVERAVAGAWRDVLGRPPAEPGTNLFAAGGTSLTAARLAAVISAATGAEVPVAAVFAAPTPEGLTRAVEAAAPRQTPPVATARAEGPLSPAQHALWLLHRVRGDDPAYHLPTLLRITGPLDVPALRAALDHLVARHDALRTSFLDGPEGVRQRVGPPVPFPLDGPAEGDPESIMDALVHRPFDLGRAPLARGALLRLGADRHDLALVVHHIVADDWSERLLLRDLGQLYTDLAAGRAPAPVAPAIRYLDVAAAQATRLAGPDGDAQRAYWRDRLAGLPLLELPAATPGTARDRPAVRSAWLPPDLASRVRATAARFATTPYLILLSAFAVLLRRWCGQDDLVVGVPFGYRDRPETQDLVGFLVSTLPLRLPVPADGTFTDLLAAVRSALVEASTHAAVPFDQMVAGAGRAGAGRDAMFRVWFNWLGAPTAPPAMPGLEVEVAHRTVPGALFDLAVYVTDAPGGYRLDLVADPAAMDERYLAPLLDQNRLLVERVCATPEAPVSAPALRPDPPEEVSATDLRTAPPDLTDLLAGVAAAAPGRVAVRDTAGDVTYERLYAQAHALSTALIAAGVRSGDVVPVYAERSRALVPALLGVLGAGAAFTILDAAHPADRLVVQLAAAGAEVGVRLADPPPAVSAACPAWLDVPTEGATAGGWPQAEAGELAYLAFTSGTGGRPKPIRGDTAPLANFLTWYARRFRLGSGDRFALLSGLGHDPLLRDVLAPLAVGGTLCVPPTGLMVRPLDLRAWLHERGVTVLHLTPALARVLSIPDGAHALKAVRLVVSAGDALYARDVAAIRSWAPAATLVNGYGTTETPQVVAFHEVPPGPPAAGRIPVGTGVPGAELLVLDGAGRPAAVGERGTIVVRGAYLARSAGVVDDPKPGHRRFATGDLGRRGPDGEVTMLGRADDQVQIRGFRVELAEVDRCLLDHPDVRVAACRALPGPDGEPYLVAYVVPRPGAASLADRVRAHVRSRLPEHMVPARLVTVPSIPLTPNRKPDRAALPVPGPEPVVEEVPRTELEHAVSAVWRRVLQVERVGVDQNFFDLGANSMLLIRAQCGLEQALARPVPVTALFEHTTVRALAAYLAGGTGAPAAAPARRDLSSLRARRSAARRDG